MTGQGRHPADPPPPQPPVSTERPPGCGAPYTPGHDRRYAFVLLVVFGTGVFLAGLELMITAVALPSILADLAERTRLAWIELRKASWIINGYLLVYVITMPLAGRLADLWGARRLFMGALVVFIGGVGAGRRGPGPRPADRRAAHPGCRWRRAGPGRRRPPRRTCSVVRRDRGRLGSSAR